MCEKFSEIFLSPKTIADIDPNDSMVQKMFIYHWGRIIGPWYSISSEEKPKPIRYVPDEELQTKNTFFWKEIIREILNYVEFDAEVNSCEATLKSLFKGSMIEMPYTLGKYLLFIHKKLYHSS